MDAYEFWKRVDEKNPYNTVKQLTDLSGIEYSRVKRNRSDERMPSVEDVYKLSSTLNIPMEYLLTGETKQVFYSPRVRAIAEALEKDEERLGAVEVLLFGKNAGQSVFTKNA